MSKVAWIALGMVVLIVVVGGGLYLSQKSAPKTSVPATQPTTAQNQPAGANNEQTFEGTLKNLMIGGRSVACTFATTNSDIAMDGTVYAAAGKVREDYKTKVAGQNMQGHMIANKSTAYMWTDMNSQGFKFVISNGTSNVTPVSGGKTPNLNQQMRFTCKNWTSDPSVFELPSNITFSDVSVRK